MIVGVFLNDADDFLSNTAKYNASLGGKSPQTSKLANLSQILTVFGLENPVKAPTHVWWFFPIGSHGPAYFPPILVNKRATFEKKRIFFKENGKN